MCVFIPNNTDDNNSFTETITNGKHCMMGFMMRFDKHVSHRMTYLSYKQLIMDEEINLTKVLTLFLFAGEQLMLLYISMYNLIFLGSFS